MKAIEALRLLEETKRMRVEADAGPLRRTRGSAVTGRSSVRCHSWPSPMPDDDLASRMFLLQLSVTSILICAPPQPPTRVPPSEIFSCVSDHFVFELYTVLLLWFLGLGSFGRQLWQRLINIYWNDSITVLARPDIGKLESL
jgi:hypothetical protein